MPDATTLRSSLIELATGPFQPGDAAAKAVAVEKLGRLWDAVVAGTIPGGTVAVPFSATLGTDEGRVGMDLVYAAVLGRDYARVDFCVADGGDLVVEQLDVFISIDAGTLQPLVDSMASHCPVDQRLADAALTDAALEAIARGETPVLEAMDVAASCGIVRTRHARAETGHRARMSRTRWQQHPSGRPRRS